MEQLNRHNIRSVFPQSFSDVEALWNDYLCEGEADEDAFTWNDIANGRSYSFYGHLAFRLTFTQRGLPRLQLPAMLYASIAGTQEIEKDKFYTVKELSPEQMELLCQQLLELKRKTFRETIMETFACCNDFNRCSDAKQCLHPDDRFFNGCYYRQALENGQVFFGRNRNV